MLVLIQLANFFSRYNQSSPTLARPVGPVVTHVLLQEHIVAVGEPVKMAIVLKAPADLRQMILHTMRIEGHD